MSADWPPESLRAEAQKEGWDDTSAWLRYGRAFQALDDRRVELYGLESEAPFLEVGGVWEKVNRGEDRPFGSALDRAIIKAMPESPAAGLREWLRAHDLWNQTPPIGWGLAIEPTPTGVWVLSELSDASCRIFDAAGNEWRGDPEDALGCLQQLPPPVTVEQVWAVLQPDS